MEGKRADHEPRKLRGCKRTWRGLLAFGRPPRGREGVAFGWLIPVPAPPSPPPAHHARLVFREESVLGAKAPWPTECPPPSLPALRADPTPAFNRAQQNRFLSPNLSAKISQHRSENLSCYTVNFTKNKNCSCHRIYISSRPQPLEGGSSLLPRGQHQGQSRRWEESKCLCGPFCLQGFQPSSVPSCLALCWVFDTHYSLVHPISEGTFGFLIL